jgi:hypothetical protein
LDEIDLQPWNGESGDFQLTSQGDTDRRGGELSFVCMQMENHLLTGVLSNRCPSASDLLQVSSEFARPGREFPGFSRISGIAAGLLAPFLLAESGLTQPDPGFHTPDRSRPAYLYGDTFSFSLSL